MVNCTVFQCKNRSTIRTMKTRQTVYTLPFCLAYYLPFHDRTPQVFKRKKRSYPNASGGSCGELKRARSAFSLHLHKHLSYDKDPGLKGVSLQTKEKEGYSLKRQGLPDFPARLLELVGLHLLKHLSPQRSKTRAWNLWRTLARDVMIRSTGNALPKFFVVPHLRLYPNAAQRHIA